MSSLKEVKQRITTVATIKKITEARQRISSAKLFRAETRLTYAKEYVKAVESLLADITIDEYISPLACKRDTGKILIVILSSNSGMAGAFNSNIIREISLLQQKHGKEEILWLPIGKKVAEALKHRKNQIIEERNELADEVSIDQIEDLSARLTELFISQKLKQIEVVYHHFKNTSNQKVTSQTLFPVDVRKLSEDNGSENKKDYLFEPRQEELAEKLLPEIIKAELYSIITENQVSEHASRTIAMQLANDNAKDLLNQLQLTYNKIRQQNITSEILDIVGGSFA